MSKYFVIEDPKPAPQDIKLKGILRRAIWLDDATVKGAPYYDAAWVTDNIPRAPEIHLHHHDFDEFLGLMGGDVNAPMELGCDVEVQVGDELMTIRNTCLIFIPAGVKHGIISVSNFTRPFLCYSGGPNTAYTAIEEKSDTSVV